MRTSNTKDLFIQLAQGTVDISEYNLEMKSICLSRLCPHYF